MARMPDGRTLMARGQSAHPIHRSSQRREPSKTMRRLIQRRSGYAAERRTPMWACQIPLGTVF